MNPYYDAFIKWQYNRLREGNRIKFGKRANVFSIIDGQVCADHDRASGEGVVPQEYTLIKLRIIPPYPTNSKLHAFSADKKVFLAPATLRPETMYGQTNCYVLPEGDYGAFEAINGDILVISERAARGLAYQGGLKEWGVAKSLLALKGKHNLFLYCSYIVLILFSYLVENKAFLHRILFLIIHYSLLVHSFIIHYSFVIDVHLFLYLCCIGTDLLGLPLKAPNAVYERVYTLPLLTISMNKGTGVVTSVPSDAPDDYVALKELIDKPLWREKFGITTEMVEPFKVVPIIEIEGYGTTSAVTMCERLDIKSSKDSDKLKKAKDEVYLKGFYEGIMLVGMSTVISIYVEYV